MDAVKFGEGFNMLIPSEASKEERVETRRLQPKGVNHQWLRDSPDSKR